MINLEKIFEKLEGVNATRTYLLILNVFLVFILILFFDLGRLPFEGLGDFMFLSLIVLAFALYRPTWAFLIFIGLVALENINMAPVEVGINIRPYQLVAACVALAVVVKHFSKRLSFEILKPKWYDWIVVVFAASGFLSALGSQNKSIALKQAVIVSSFAVVYFLVRNLVRNLNDLKRVIPFFFGSSFMVSIYAIWQNWMFQRGRGHFEVMPGRVNATFTEADWLGAFLVLVIAIFSVVIFEIKKRKNIKYNIALWCFLTTTIISLILTVARSAWLGAFGVLGLFFGLVLIGVKSGKVELRWRIFANHGLFVSSALIVSLLMINIFNLTNFELGGRAVSATGLQQITIACENRDSSVPDVIDEVGQLQSYGCEHINLEDIKRFQQEGMFISKIQRKDPNVNIRAEIYQKSWSEIKRNSILGIGWGNISEILGKDERGAGLNSSNIFLEVWLGAGILGLVSFMIIIGNVLWRGFVFLRKGSEILGMFLILGMTAILIPNLFNAGILLGFLWVFLGIAGVEEK